MSSISVASGGLVNILVDDVFAVINTADTRNYKDEKWTQKTTDYDDANKNQICGVVKLIIINE